MSGHTDDVVGATALLTRADRVTSEARADGDQVAPDGDSAVSRLCDEQSVLLWQACAYAEDLIAATESGRDLDPARDALLGFIHFELLPYLRFEEREFAGWEPHGGRLNDQQLADHDQIRSGAGNVETSHNRRPLTAATRTLVGRLDRHIRSEQGWAAEPIAGNERHPDSRTRWVPAVLGDQVDLDSLPIDDRDILVLDRLQRMRRGDVVRLRAGTDLHPLWCRHHARSPGTHVWVYEQEGPSDWFVRVTRRDPAS